MSDHYRTIAAPVDFSHKIERSEFLGLAFPVTSEEQFFAELERAQKKYFDATHHCWAFRVWTAGVPPASDGLPGRRLENATAAPGRMPGAGGRDAPPPGESRSRSSDAGEPSGTAGKPILAAIEGPSLHDVAVIVVRWYGGTKLGTGGLSRAYRDTAAETLRLATPLDRYIYERVRVTVPFDAMNNLYRLVSPPDILLVEQRYEEQNEFVFEVRASRVSAFQQRLVELRLIPR